MPARRRNPYADPRRRAPHDPDYVHKTIRMSEDFWAMLERRAVDEQVSVNSLCLALLDVATLYYETKEGKARIHEACNRWRTRRETALNQRRRARLQADDAAP